MRTFDREEFTRELTAQLSQIAKIPAEDISLNDNLREDIGLDSLQSMELLLRISENWDIDVEIEDMIDVKTVGNVVEVISQVAKRE